MDKEIVIAGPSESAESPYELLDDRFRACQGEEVVLRRALDRGTGIFSSWS
jgi:hypothetical protein